MKKFMILNTFIFLIGSNYAQFDCGTVGSNLKSSSNIPNASDYIPNSSTPIKYIRVNIHFNLRESGEPGNFTKSDDGRGNTNYTGYDYASDLINKANERLASNIKMNLPPNNTTKVLDRKYKYVLNAVFFNKTNTYYTYKGSYPTYFDMNDLLGQNMGKCINVYLQGLDPARSSGVSRYTDDRVVALNGRWDTYFKDPSGELFKAAGLLNHEIGHSLSLKHDIIPKNKQGKEGECDPEDYCTDTPTSTELITYGIYPCDDCDRWDTGGIPTCPNNQMGYSGSNALTPLQLGRVHWTIENELAGYKSCFAPYLNINLTSFTDNASYICTTLTIPTGTSIAVNNNKSLYISTENFTANGALNVAVGSTLIIKPLSVNCN